MDRVWWRYFNQQAQSFNSLSQLALTFQFVGVPAAGQRLSLPLAQPGLLLGIAGESFAFIGTAPTGTIALMLNTVHLGVVTARGVVTVTPGGLVTFPVFGQLPLLAQDIVQLVAPNPADATFADSTFVFQYAQG